ncbi:MAG: 2-oxoacid:acceptor oxidoreductase subunit alpha [Myxococcota bacterium]
MEPAATQKDRRAREILDAVVIRFAGDSGDGMQLTGNQFTQSTALMGNDLATFPDFPAEIRAPAGTTYGVSGFQVHFAAHDVRTPGDTPDALVAMNPAALKVHLPDLRQGGLLLLNVGAFTTTNLNKAGYETDPLEDPQLDAYRVLRIDINKLTAAAVKDFGLSAKQAARCKNMWTLGLVFWLYDRNCETTFEFLSQKFRSQPVIAEANIAAVKAGHAFGETAEMPSGIGAYQVPPADLPPGTYRNIQGNDATAWGIVAGARLAGLPVVYGSYPITPASSLLHALAKLKHFDVTTFQAEDEIAACCAAIGASFGGALGVTATSGPGLALKGEALGLAIATELPLVVIDVQRGGPSTGLPTKTEQSDLMMAIWGRNGDAPMPVLAARTPSDCFDVAIEAVRIATRYMTPVMLLTDGYLANGSEPWKLPEVDQLEPFPVRFREDPEGYHPFLRDEKTLARPWVRPGTDGMAHRIGGLEKHHDSGNISYDPSNHLKMSQIRAERVARIANDLPLQKIEVGEEEGTLLVVSWGSTYGAVRQAVRVLAGEGCSIGHTHLRYLNPLPQGLGELLGRFERVIVPEKNQGQLVHHLRAQFSIELESYARPTGAPFRIVELETVFRSRLEPS